MAKTIRDMAIEYAPHPKDGNWDKMQDQLMKLAAYEAGANAVLNEIEAILSNPCYPQIKLFRIRMNIKKLKGE